MTLCITIDFHTSWINPNTNQIFFSTDITIVNFWDTFDLLFVIKICSYWKTMELGNFSHLCKLQSQGSEFSSFRKEGKPREMFSASSNVSIGSHSACPKVICWCWLVSSTLVHASNDIEQRETYSLYSAFCDNAFLNSPYNMTNGIICTITLYMPMIDSKARPLMLP